MSFRIRNTRRSRTRPIGRVIFLVGLVVTLFATEAFGQDASPLPSETVKANPATTTPEPVSDSTELSIGAGGLFSSGNARTIAANSLAKFRIRRDEHQFSAAATANYARAGKTGEPVDTTVENYQGLLRYDLFFGDQVSLFLQGTGRHDRFQGLDLRLNVDPGIAYYFINERNRRLNIEVGYDFQYDIRRDEARVVPPPVGAPAGTPSTELEKTKTLHNTRAFVGFENRLYAGVSFTTSIEYLQNVSDVDTYRLVFDLGLKSNIAEKLAIAMTYTMRYENKPLPTIEKTDSIASINLVYTF